MEVVAKKYFGQNFLKDSTVLEQIIQAMPESDHPVVEIGPGLGDLTQCLLRKRRVEAYEVDKDLCVYLEEKFADALKTGEIKLHKGDVLAYWNKSNTLCKKPYYLVANLPYYIATPIVLKALYDPNCRYIEVMVQKEVAQKFAAKPKTKAFSSLAIIAQSVADVRLLMDVPPSAFDPMPKVTSTIVCMQKRTDFIHGQQPIFGTQEELKGFEEYLKTAFLAPRKQWIKNMSSKYDRSVLEKMLKEAKISPQIRPHEIDTATHHHLFIQLLKVNDHVRRDKQQTAKC
jgi:16S rRNA (adenine1518-N6/adenine1519-N6)-dimethyltransferase